MTAPSKQKIGLSAGPESLFAKRVRELRHLIRSHSHHILANTHDPFSTAVLAWACWSEGRKIIFPPNTQTQSLESLAEEGTLVVLSGNETIDPTTTISGLDFDTLYNPQNTNDPKNTKLETTILAEFHTSGSTGKPLLLRKNARQLFDEARFLSELFEIQASQVLMTGVPARHLYGFLFSVMIPSVSGCELITTRPLHTETILHLADRFKANYFVSTPLQLRALSSNSTLPIFTKIFSSGAPLAMESRQILEAAENTLIEIFGSTETGGIATRNNQGNLWTPFSLVEVKIEDARMHVRSPFLDNPEIYYPMQDRIILDKGKFKHLGRADDIVKIGGKRISKNELKNAILSHPQVKDVALTTTTETRLRLHAFVIAKSGSNLTQRQLYRDLVEVFDPTTMPRLHFVTTLKRSALGKISQNELHRMLQNSKPGIDIRNKVSTEDLVTFDAFVPEDCLYFEGHFDGFKILPGVIQVLMIEEHILIDWPALKNPIRITRIKFRRPISPNTLLSIRLEKKEKDEDTSIIFTIQRQGDVCSSGHFVFAK